VKRWGEKIEPLRHNNTLTAVALDRRRISTGALLGRGGVMNCRADKLGSSEEWSLYSCKKLRTLINASYEGKLVKLTGAGT